MGRHSESERRRTGKIHRMQLKKPTVRGCGLLNTTLVLVAGLGLANAVLAQQPVQTEDRQARQLRVERALQIYEVESSAHVKLAHEKWQEGHLDDALKEFQQCLVLAKKIFGDEANSETVKTIQAIARLHESNGSFTRAVVDLRRALDFQITGTGA